MNLTFLLTLAAAFIGILPAPVSVEAGDGYYPLSGNPKAVSLVLDPSMTLPPEGYELIVDRKGVRGRAPSEAGLFYARQSLEQLIRPDGTVPFVKITDYPRFAWRGFHVDPCRHFLPVEEVKKQIDILAAYKINVMHWHLTDDQGWRIEIKKYPRLTEVGAWRTEFDGSVHGGFYTQEEIREVVAYAAERFVTVVPEIEMPGHAISAIRAYPELSCTGETVNTFYTWGTPDISLCVGKESTFAFLEDVIAEVVQLFPSEYIHIGGDECRKNRWEHCPLCQARIQAEGLAATEAFTAEQRLQSYAVHRMESILRKYGRKLVGWDEILEGGLSPNATVMSWRGEKGGIQAAEAGHHVIMTPSHEGMYLDHYQGDPKIEPVAIGHYTTLEKVYHYDPVPQALKESGHADMVLGVQCNNWSEYLYSLEHRDYMLFPRAFALAEIAWSPAEGKDFGDFCRRVDLACQRLDRIGVRYHIPLPEQPEGSCNELALIDKAEVAFTTSRLEEMVWTLDGTEPTADSRRYMFPFTFTEDATLKIATLTRYGKLSPVRTLHIRKQQPLPAVEPAFSGLRAQRADGRFVTAADLSGASWREIPVSGLRDLGKQELRDRNLPDSTRFYGAVAEGYFKVSHTDVYRFSSDCDQVWIDGQLLIDNGAEVKRFSRHDKELALKRGAHAVKVVFLYNVTGGWNTIQNKTDVLIRRYGSPEWKSLKILQ